MKMKMKMRRNGFWTIGFVGAALLAALAFSACGSSSSSSSATSTTAPASTPAAATTPADGTVDVVLNEMNIIPTPDQTTAGEVTWNVKNTGSVMHEMVVIKTDKKAGDLLGLLS